MLSRFSKNNSLYNSVPRKIQVPLYEFATAGEPLDDLPIREVDKIWVNKYHHKIQYSYMTVQGHSMDDSTEMGIKDGSTVVLNMQEVEEARIGGIYLWQIPGTSPCIKVLDVVNGVLHLSSWNMDRKFHPFALPEGARPAARVIGVLDEDGNIQHR